MNERSVVEALDRMAKIVRDFAVALDHLAAAFDSNEPQPPMSHEAPVVDELLDAEPLGRTKVKTYVVELAQPEAPADSALNVRVVGEETTVIYDRSQVFFLSKCPGAKLWRGWETDDGLFLKTPLCESCRGSGLAGHVEWLAEQGMDVGGRCPDCKGTGLFTVEATEEQGPEALDEVEAAAAGARGEDDDG